MLAHVDELAGWASSLILLLTIASQVVKQWREGAHGVSHWLFVGQIAASAGFVVYSVLKHDTVFIVTNTLILLSAIAGLLSFFRGRRHAHFQRFASGEPS